MKRRKGDRPMTEIEKLKADMDAKRAAYAVAYAAIDAAYAARDASNKAYKAALAAQEKEQNND
jgi:hypothetical protein